MNFTFYSSLAHLPIGVAVTIEFIGPLTLAAVLSRRLVDAVAVVAAGLGVVLISEALSTPLRQLEWAGHRARAGGGSVLGRHTSCCPGAPAPRSPARGAGPGDGRRHGRDPAAGPGVACRSGPPRPCSRGSASPCSRRCSPTRSSCGPAARWRAKVFGILLSLEPAAAALAGLIVLDQRADADPAAGHGAGRRRVRAGAGAGRAQGPRGARPGRERRPGSGVEGVALVAAGLHQAERRS